MRAWATAACALALCACAATSPRAQPPARVGAGVAPVRATRLPASAPQGALVRGTTQPAARVRVDGREVRVGADGGFVFGIGREATGAVEIAVTRPGRSETRRVAIVPRDWPEETVAGVPPSTVEPPPAIAARIAREQAQVEAARTRDDARDDYEEAFAWPVAGRISGRFGSRRVYLLPDGRRSAGTGHSGMDIAAAQGTPVRAPAAGVVTFAAPDLYLTGGTVLLDHGHGVSSNFLHLSRIDVAVGDHVVQGQAIGAVGATGRASGPHLHWGMNWFDVRVDPLLVLGPAPVGDR